MTTDLSLSPLVILRIYSFRFKIESVFKQTLYALVTNTCHFWMSTMTPRPNAGDRYLHRKSKTYRGDVSLLQYLSVTCTKALWQSLGSWLRATHDSIYPSVQVIALALRNMLPELVVNSPEDPILVIFR